MVAKVSSLCRRRRECFFVQGFFDDGGNVACDGSQNLGNCAIFNILCGTDIKTMLMVTTMLTSPSWRQTAGQH